MGMSGYAYEALQYMVERSEIHMYDVFTEKGMYKIDSNSYYHYNEYYDFKRNDYDLVLSDAWFESKYHVDLDPDKVCQKNHYSIKKFPEENIDTGNIYYQVFKTEGFEERHVSREIYYNYRSQESLGVCVGCKELKYLLKHAYPRELFRLYMDTHKINCVDMEPRQLASEQVRYKFTKQELSENDRRESRSLPWDFLIEGLPHMVFNYSAMRNTVLRVSSPSVCPSSIYVNVRMIYFEMDGSFFCHGEVDGGKLKKYSTQVKVISQYMQEKNVQQSIKEKIKQPVKVNRSEEISNYSFEVYGKVTGVGCRRVVKAYCDANSIKGEIFNVADDHVRIRVIATEQQATDLGYFLRVPNKVKMKVDRLFKCVVDDQWAYNSFSISNI